MRAVIVGASSGLGRSIGLGLAQQGHEVALLARRRDRLDDAAAAAGGTAHAIGCDVTDPTACHRAVAECVEAMGGIDAVVYATGIGVLGRLVDLDADAWARSFATNVTGAALVTAAAMPHLTESGGRAVYLSSISASMTAPWPGLGSYVVSKAALDKLVEAWRVEHPAVGFTRLTVGDCGGGEGASATEFTADWDQEQMSEFGLQWFEKGLVSGSLIDVDEVVRVVETVLLGDPSASMPVVVVTPRPTG